MRRPVVLLVSVLALAACTGRPAPDATGQEIFEQLCARCHGSGLQGDVGPALGAGSEIADEPDDFLHMTIERGRGRMPSFRRTLTEEQIDRVIAYIREVQGGS